MGKTKGKLAVPIIALLHLYKKNPVNRDNCAEIAANNGYKSKYSGEGLFQDYTKYSNNSNRTGVDETSYKKNLTRLNHLSKVIPLLKGNHKKDAQNDHDKLYKSIQEHFKQIK